MLESLVTDKLKIITWFIQFDPYKQLVVGVRAVQVSHILYYSGILLVHKDPIADLDVTAQRLLLEIGPVRRVPEHGLAVATWTAAERRAVERGNACAALRRMER